MCSPRLCLTAAPDCGSLLCEQPWVCTAAEPAKSGDQAAISGKIVDALPSTPILRCRSHCIALTRRPGVGDASRELAASAATDAAGTYKFPGLGDGYFMLSVEKAGFPRRSVRRPSRAMRQSKSKSC